MKSRYHVHAVSLLSIAVLSACGGGSSTPSASTPTVGASSLTVQTMLSDAASEDWSNISVSVRSIDLLDTAGNKTSVALPATPYRLNLAQLDNLAEVINNTQLSNSGSSPISYTGVSLTLDANPGDVALTVSGDPEPGFIEAPSTVIPSSRIQIQGATGTAGALTVSVTANFTTPLVVPAASATPSTATAAVNVEFDLAHPAFIVGHAPLGGGSTIWAVNFSGPVKHKPVGRLSDQVLRHAYGTVSSVSSDNKNLNFNKTFPTQPIVTPETGVASSQSLSVAADASNGTLFYDIDGKKTSTIKDFSTVAATLAAGEFIRVAARYQDDGSLVATRIWAAKSFNSVFVSPEGHVLHIAADGSKLTVDDAAGHPLTVAVNGNTQFFFRTPNNGASDVTPIGSGPSFLLTNLARGFKVHIQPVDLTASPIVAQTIDIESAPFGGRIASATNAGFILSSQFNTHSDDYRGGSGQNFAYISASTPNGLDGSGAAVNGFKFWNFAFPSLVDTGASAIADFVKATNGNANFGGSVGAIPVHGETHAVWGDAAQTQGWSAPSMVLTPSALPRGSVASALVASGTAGISSFGLKVAGGSNTVPVNISSAAQQATLVYSVNRSGDNVTVSPLDVSTPGGLSALTTALSLGVRVDVSGLPQADGSIKAYVVKYYSGTGTK